MNKGQNTYSDSYLEYFGGYMTLMKELINNGDFECIDFRISDYPDWSTIQKYTNEMFNDYI